MAGYFEIACGFLAVIVLLYHYFTSTFDFWKVRGVPGPKPVPPFGNFQTVMLGKVSVGCYLKKVYDEYENEPMVGLFHGRTPVLLLNDPELIKDVLIKDFPKFADRGFPTAERVDPLSQNLFALEPARWRPLRTKLSPVFTSAKLKDMFKMIVECSKHLEKYLEKTVANGQPIEVRELAAKFTTDVICTCAFDIDTKALADKDSIFRQMGKMMTTPTLAEMIRFRFRMYAPQLYNLLGYILPQEVYMKFIVETIRDTIKHRRENNVVKNDLIDTLKEMQDQPDKLENIKLTDTFIAAQAFIFFFAGFESSSSTTSNALYELALHQDVQDKLRQEIKEEYIKNGGDLQYENIQKLKYLDAVFRETLRKYPVVTFLMRQSTTSYTFDGTKVTVPKDQKVWIPIYGIQRNPSIYPDPDKFDPERFIGEAASARHPMHYLPFGDGPRNCIGARFGIYQTKIGLMKILGNYKVDACEMTPIPYENDPRTFILAPKGGIHLRFTKIAESQA